MKGQFAVTLLGACLIAGCHDYGRLYPVQGPLAAMAPPPVYTAKITLVPDWSKPITVGNSAYNKAGKISVVLANGEQLNGTWKEVYDKAGTDATAANPLAAAWDAVYGQGYYTAHVLGTPLLVHTELTGPLGTVLTVEWYERQYGTGDNARLIDQGVAKDNRGNVYKLAF
ncbi:MAG: hypothetical protein ABSE53_06030 [Terracidiphilus sp.]|jgi:hypothetical protein